MAKVIDIFLIYQFLKRLVTPFEQWDAYKTGVIDKNGKVIAGEDRTDEQKKSWGYYDRLLANLKKLLGKIPGGKTRLASFAAALLLLRESEETLNEDDMEVLEERLMFYMEEAKMLTEDAPTMNAGSGNIAGIGVGPDGEPGVNKKRKKSANTVLTGVLFKRKELEK